MVLNTETCSFVSNGVVIQVFVGLTPAAPPGTVKKAVKVANLPHGIYVTYTDSKETQVRFYKGPASTAIIGLVTSSTAKITKAHLQTIARDLYASI